MKKILRIKQRNASTKGENRKKKKLSVPTFSLTLMLATRCSGKLPNTNSTRKIQPAALTLYARVLSSKERSSLGQGTTHNNL
jgi:hypothetical protein